MQVTTGMSQLPNKYYTVATTFLWWLLLSYPDAQIVSLQGAQGNGNPFLCAVNTAPERSETLHYIVCDMALDAGRKYITLQF
jgi:hypothetical protein